MATFLAVTCLLIGTKNGYLTLSWRAAETFIIPLILIGIGALQLAMMNSPYMADQHPKTLENKLGRGSFIIIILLPILLITGVKDHAFSQKPFVEQSPIFAVQAGNGVCLTAPGIIVFKFSPATMNNTGPCLAMSASLWGMLVALVALVCILSNLECEHYIKNNNIQPKNIINKI